MGEWLRGGPDEQPHEKSETSPPLLPDRPDLAIFTTTPAVAEAPLSPTSPLSIRRRLSEILFKGNKPPKAVHFGAEAEEPGPAPTIAVPSLSQSVPLRRKPPPKSEAFTNLLRSLSVPSGLSAPSQLSGPSSPGALIAAAKTPALTEIPRLADEIGGLHADARGEMGMRTPFVEMAKDSQEEALMSSGSSASSGSDSGSNDGGEAEAPATPMTPVAAPAMPVPRPAGTRVKIERKRSGFVEGARHFFGLNKGV